MTVYKAFGPGMVCKEYHYKPGQVNAEAIANCTRNGIHAAEDPLDCLSYYSWDGKNEFWRGKNGNAWGRTIFCIYYFNRKSALCDSGRDNRP